MPENIVQILLLIAAMWFLQLFLTYKQSMRFNDILKPLRLQGKTAVGLGGRRYRGGRAFVAIAQQDGIVVDARLMTGYTVFAAPKDCPELKGLSLTLLASDDSIPGMKDKVRSAAQMAASTLLTPARVEQSE
jgi:DNA-binding transcriptional regulator of glucitol operon